MILKIFGNTRISVDFQLDQSASRKLLNLLTQLVWRMWGFVSHNNFLICLIESLLKLAGKTATNPKITFRLMIDAIYGTAAEVGVEMSGNSPLLPRN